jgi:hypothetical protein
MRTVAFILALAFPFGAVATDDLEFAVVSGVETFQRLKKTSNLYPWEHAAPGEIVISNACGFARVKYYRVETPGFARIYENRNLQRWDALVLLGEWCQIKEFILEGLTLVAYRKWKGEDYIVSFAELFVDRSERLYVEDVHFIEESGLGNLMVSMEASDDPAECASNAEECSKDRLYLSSVPMRANKSPERTREK